MKCTFIISGNALVSACVGRIFFIAGFNGFFVYGFKGLIKTGIELCFINFMSILKFLQVSAVVMDFITVFFLVKEASHLYKNYYCVLCTCAL